jgi:hypothetical protein
LKAAARFLVVCVCSSACASAPPPYINTCTDYDTARSDPNAKHVTRDQIKAQTHALFAALDRADAAGFSAELGDSFVLIEAGVVRDRAFLLEGIRQRAGHAAPGRTRTWQNEQIRLSEDAAIFIGEAIVSEPGDLQHAGREYAGWNTLVFAPERGSFRAMSWQWVPSGGDPVRNECDPAQ